MRLTKFKVVLLLLVLGLSMGSAWAQCSGTKYVALGDSLTAGFQSGGLAEQYNSFPALIFGQLNNACGTFEQPLVSQPGIPSQLHLVGLFPTVIEPKEGDAYPMNLGLARPYDNLGVPGATVNDVVETTSGGIFNLILRNPALGNTTQLQQALSLQPDFMTLWIGNNDALGAATSGMPALLTPLEDFQEDFETIAGAIAASGADFVVANIPDVTTIPFVNTIPSFLVNPATNQPVQINGEFVWLIGPDGTTPLTPADKVLLTGGGYMALGCGVPAAAGGVAGLPAGTQPACPSGGLPDTAVLLADQVAEIQTRVAEFNAVIENTANTLGAGFVDARAILTDIANTGLELGGISFDSSFLTGGFFSYDGVHLTDLGYAYVANRFIDEANETFEMDIPSVDLYPFVFGRGAAAARLPAYLAKDAVLSPAAINNILLIFAGKDFELDLDVELGTIGPRGRRIPPRSRIVSPLNQRRFRRYREPLRF